MFIQVPQQLLKQQDFDSCLRFACDELSKTGIQNFIHYLDQRVVELFNPRRMMAVTINYPMAGISLTEL